MERWWLSLEPEIQAAIIGVVGALIGAFVGAVLGARFTRKGTMQVVERQLEMTDQARRQERLEDAAEELMRGLNVLSIRLRIGELDREIADGILASAAAVRVRAGDEAPHLREIVKEHVGRVFDAAQRAGEAAIDTRVGGPAVPEEAKLAGVAASKLAAMIGSWIVDPQLFELARQQFRSP